MKTIIATVAGTLAVALAAFSYGTRARSAPAAQLMPDQAVATEGASPARLVSFNGTLGSSSATSPLFTSPATSANGQVLVNCAPGQQTFVRQTLVNGQPVAQVDCVANSVQPAYGVDAEPYVRRDLSVARVVPARDVYYTDRPVVRERVVRTTRRRSLQKTALVIGGTTAASAGVGGIIGGKKGALIGAAIGGGLSTLYEATRH